MNNLLEKKYISTLLFTLFTLLSVAQVSMDSIGVHQDDVIWQDSIPLQTDSLEVPLPSYTFFTSDSLQLLDSLSLSHRLDSLVRQPIKKIDSLMYESNILYVPLVYMGYEIRPVWDGKTVFDNPKQSKLHIDSLMTYPHFFDNTSFVRKLRQSVRAYISRHRMDLYVTTIDDLPNMTTLVYRRLGHTNLRNLKIQQDDMVLNPTSIGIQKLAPLYWTKKANAILQFSQNYISQNWHRGGNSNLAFLKILSGELNYDNLKKTRWENRIEWRSGFSSVEGDTLRKILINDDLLRYITKFGIKAKGNWYYSATADVSTQLYNNYKGINSTVMKARFLTPVRATLGVGMDYQYQKIFSMMVAPITLKYIYLNDTVRVNPNLFGLKKGENQLRQIGSSFRAQLKYFPISTWSIDSKLTFYTNYKKVEIDWEIVNNFIINRYMTTRLLLNPRYDNTVILKGGERAEIQFKELLSVGFSFRLI